MAPIAWANFVQSERVGEGLLRQRSSRYAISVAECALARDRRDTISRRQRGHHALGAGPRAGGHRGVIENRLAVSLGVPGSPGGAAPRAALRSDNRGPTPPRPSRRSAPG